MPKVKEIQVRREYHGQVWYELKPVENVDDVEGKVGSSLEKPPHRLPIPPDDMEP